MLAGKLLMQIKYMVYVAEKCIETNRTPMTKPVMQF